MKQESKHKKNVGTSVMGNDIETTQNTMHVLDENKISTYQHVKQLKAQVMILNVLKLLL